MKTYETEKHNIPEGATHYLNETDTDCFAWYREDTKEVMVNGYVVSEWEDAGKEENLTDLKPIPQTKEVEWVNGDKCIYEGNLYDYQCISSWDKDACVLSGASPESKPFTDAWIDELSKPESPEDREKREELESAYELYCELNANHNCVEFDRFKKSCDNWIRVVRKTGYRKGGE